MDNRQKADEYSYGVSAIAKAISSKKLYDSSEIDKIPNRITILESYKGVQLMEIYELQPDTNYVFGCDLNKFDDYLINPDTGKPFGTKKYVYVKVYSYPEVKIDIIDASGFNGGSKTVNGFDKTVNAGKQGKHIVGNNNYIQGRSVFNGTVDDAQKLVDEFAGTGEWIGQNKERVNFGKVIGEYVNPATGESVETTVGMIHYSKTGTHIVPAQPIE